MADLATQHIDLDGEEPDYAACSGGGDKFVPGDDVFIHVKNGHSAPQTVTIVTPKTVGGQAVADVAVAVPNAKERMIGPFPKSLFANPADSGKASITYSGVTLLTIGVYDLQERSAD